MASKSFVRDRRFARPRLRPGQRVQVLQPSIVRAKPLAARYLGRVSIAQLGRLYSIAVRFAGTRGETRFALARDQIVPLRGQP